MTPAHRHAMAPSVCASLVALAIMAGTSLSASTAAAQSRSGGGSYTSFAVSTPMIALNAERTLHLELNLAGEATLALEWTVKGEYEELDEDEIAQTGESRASKGYGVSLLYARYSQPMTMGGFYWALGAGYRQETVAWRTRADAEDPGIALVHQDSLLHHDAKLTGTTGTFRAGYRYVGVDWPVLIGGYLGARHFQAGVQDVDGKDEAAPTDAVTVAMTDREKERLRRKYSTRPELGLEVGFRF